MYKIVIVTIDTNKEVKPSLFSMNKHVQFSTTKTLVTEHC